MKDISVVCCINQPSALYTLAVEGFSCAITGKYTTIRGISPAPDYGAFSEQKVFVNKE